MMSALKEYRLQIGGSEHTLLLDDVDAQRHGVLGQHLTPETAIQELVEAAVEVAAVDQVENKARSARTVANKSLK